MPTINGDSDLVEDDQQPSTSGTGNDDDHPEIPPYDVHRALGEDI